MGAVSRNIKMEKSICVQLRNWSPLMNTTFESIRLLKDLGIIQDATPGFIGMLDFLTHFEIWKYPESTGHTDSIVLLFDMIEKPSSGLSASCDLYEHSNDVINMNEHYANKSMRFLKWMLPICPFSSLIHIRVNGLKNWALPGTRQYGEDYLTLYIKGWELT